MPAAGGSACPAARCGCGGRSRNRAHRPPCAACRHNSSARSTAARKPPAGIRALSSAIRDRHELVMQRALGGARRACAVCRVDASGGLQRAASRRSQKTSFRKTPRTRRARHRARRRSARRALSCIPTNGLSAATGLRCSLYPFRHAAQRRHQRVGVGEQLVLQPERMQPRELLRHWGADQCAHERLHERAIEAPDWSRIPAPPSRNGDRRRRRCRRARECRRASAPRSA